MLQTFQDDCWMNNEDLIKDDLIYDMDNSSVGTSLNTTRAPSPVIVDEPLIQPNLPKVEKIITTKTSNLPQTPPGRTGRAKRPPKRFDD